MRILLTLFFLMSSVKGEVIELLKDKIQNSNFIIYHNKKEKVTVLLKHTRSKQWTLDNVLKIASQTDHPHFLFVNKMGWSTWRVRNGVVNIRIDGNNTEIKTSELFKVMQTTYSRLFGNLATIKK